jgi:hypothetical protein
MVKLHRTSDILTSDILKIARSQNGSFSDICFMAVKLLVLVGRFGLLSFAHH